MLHLLYCLLACCTPWELPGGYVRSGSTYLHGSPGHDVEIVSEAIYGTPVIRLEERDGWTYIELPDGYRGWVDEQELVVREQRYASKGDTVWVRVNRALLYRCPDTSPYPVIGALPFGAKLEVVERLPEQGDRWLKVKLVDDQECYIHRGDTTTRSTPLSIGEMAQLGRQFLGLPYIWGGVSSFGFDCSGLIQTLYAHAGIKIPRDTGDQLRCPAPEVEWSDLEIGDVIYFTDATSAKHVVLYVGNREVLQAVVGTYGKMSGTQISSLDLPEIKEGLIGIRRFRSLSDGN